MIDLAGLDAMVGGKKHPRLVTNFGNGYGILCNSVLVGWLVKYDDLTRWIGLMDPLGFCHQEYVEMVIFGDLKEKASESRSVQCRLKLEYFLIHHLHGCEWNVKTTLESQGGAKRTFYPSLVF